MPLNVDLTVKLQCNIKCDAFPLGFDVYLTVILQLVLKRTSSYGYNIFLVSSLTVI